MILLDKIVARDRLRRDLGDLGPLMASINEVGLIHPPAVRKVDGELVLVAGQRRLEAMKQLGWYETEVTVCETVEDELLAMKAEMQENTCREPLSPAELKAAADRLLPRALNEAKERQREGSARGGRSEGHVHRTQPSRTSRNAKAEVADALGTSRQTLNRILKVYESTDDSDPTVAAVAQHHVEAWESGQGIAPASADKDVSAARRDPTASPTRQVVKANGQAAMVFTPESKPPHSRKTWRERYGMALITFASTAEHFAPGFPPEKVRGIARSTEEYLGWIAELRQARTQLSRYINQLGGITDEIVDQKTADR